MYRYSEGVKASMNMNMDEQYQKGVEDSWNAFRKLILSVSNGGLTIQQIRYIFPGCTTIASVLSLPPQVIVYRINEYEERLKK